MSPERTGGGLQSEIIGGNGGTGRQHGGRAGPIMGQEQHRTPGTGSRAAGNAPTAGGRGGRRAAAHRATGSGGTKLQCVGPGSRAGKPSDRCAGPASTQAGGQGRTDGPPCAPGGGRRRELAQGRLTPERPPAHIGKAEGGKREAARHRAGGLPIDFPICGSPPPSGPSERRPSSGATGGRQICRAHRENGREGKQGSRWEGRAHQETTGPGGGARGKGAEQRALLLTGSGKAPFVPAQPPKGPESQAAGLGRTLGRRPHAAGHRAQHGPAGSEAQREREAGGRSREKGSTAGNK